MNADNETQNQLPDTEDELRNVALGKGKDTDWSKKCAFCVSILKVME